MFEERIVEWCGVIYYDVIFVFGFCVFVVEIEFICV